MSTGTAKIRTGIRNVAGTDINPATEETLQDVVSALSGQSGVRSGKATDAYAYQAKAETATYVYWFFEEGSGDWYILRKTKSNGVMSYAKGTGGYESAYNDPSSDPNGPPIFGTYDETFDPVGGAQILSPDHFTFNVDGELLVSLENTVIPIPTSMFGYSVSEDADHKIRIDRATRAVNCLDYPHHEIHAGTHYHYCDSVELDNAQTQSYLITTPNTTSWTHLSFEFDGSAITQFQLFEGTDRNGVILQSTFNNNRNSSNTAGTTVHKNVSGGTIDGTMLYTHKSGSATNQSRGAASSETNNEFVLKQGTKHLIVITSGTNDNLTNIKLSWYEHTNIS